MSDLPTDRSTNRPTDRPNKRELEDLVHDAVQSRGLGDDARDVSRLISLQFRDRLRQAEGMAAIAVPAARRALPAARRAVPAARRAMPAVRRALPAARRALPAARRALPAARKAVPAARNVVPAVRGAGADAAGRLPRLTGRGREIAARRIGNLGSTRLGRTAAIGAAAGAAASLAMGGLMLAARRLGLLRGDREASAGERPEEALPAEAAPEAEAETGAGPDRDEAQATAVGSAASAAGANPTGHGIPAGLLHVGFGATLGIGFGLLHSQLPSRWRAPLPTLAEALVLATGLSVASSAGIVPTPGPVAAPGGDAGPRATRYAAHWLFGAVLGAGLVAGLSRAE